MSRGRTPTIWSKMEFQMEQIIAILISKGKRIIILHARGTDGWAGNALLLSAKNIQNCSVDLVTRIQHYLKLGFSSS
jgi:hypothetical protein